MSMASRWIKSIMCPKCDGMQRFSERNDTRLPPRYFSVICLRCRGRGLIDIVKTIRELFLDIVQALKGGKDVNETRRQV